MPAVSNLSAYEDRCRLKSIIAIFIGAGLGALLRWWLGMTLNAYFPSIPPGTLAANLIGGYIIGVAIALFATSTAVGAGVALIRHHRLLRRSDYVFDILIRNCCLVGAEAITRCVRCGRVACGGLCVDDLCGNRNGGVDEKLSDSQLEIARRGQRVIES